MGHDPFPKKKNIQSYSPETLHAQEPKQREPTEVKTLLSKWAPGAEPIRLGTCTFKAFAHSFEIATRC